MTTANEANRAAKYIPIVGWLSAYRVGWLCFDLVAGLIAAVVIPQAIAYTTIAGLPIDVGLLITLISMLIFAWLVFALLGTSRPPSIGATSTIAMQSATVLASVVPDGDGSLGKPK